MSKDRIFISYSHRANGPKWKAALLRALHVFERHHLLDVWEDGKIRVSSFWDDDILQAMTSAQLAVILLTDEALKSEYILTKELPCLCERQQREKLPVFPVICEPCDWKAHDWLRATQAPNESNPLSGLSDDKIERVFRHLATAIAENLNRIALGSIADPEAAPEPPRLYLDKFPLTRGSGQREEKLIGREQELALLDLAFAQPHTAIVSLIAWGGVGKTMLVQHWLQRLQREGWFGARRVYAWSFYSQGTKEDRQASEDTFLAHALEWFGVECEPTLSPWDKGRLLADAVARERTLLILDGIEPLQYPPGPMGGQLRAPGVQSLLKQLVRKANNTEHRGLCLVTTREPLTDLADFQRREGSPWGSVLRVDLGNLTEEAGAALLHHAGAKRAGAAEIKTNDTELLAASRDLDGHALTLNLLGRFLARAHGGNIRRRDVVKFEEADRKDQGGTTFKMLAAFENWFDRSGEFGARQLAVLRILGLFDRPADPGCIAALRRPPIIMGLTDPLFHARGGIFSWRKKHQPLPEEDWSTATSFLADFGLVMIQTDVGNSESLLDCHPLIRQHFATRIRTTNLESWRSSHRRLYEHLKCTTTDFPDNIHGLQPLYHAVHHASEAEICSECFNSIYVHRILRYKEYFSPNKTGAFESDLKAVRAFFDVPWTQPRSSTQHSHVGFLLNEAFLCLRALCRFEEAVPLLDAAQKDAAKRKSVADIAICLVQRMETELLLGNIKEALFTSFMASQFHRDFGSSPAELTTLYSADAETLFRAGNTHAAMARCNEVDDICAREQIYENTFVFVFGEVLLSEIERSAWQVFLKKKELVPTGHSFNAEAQMKRCDSVFAWCVSQSELAQAFNDVLGKALAKVVLAKTYVLKGIIGSRGQPEVLALAQKDVTLCDSAVTELASAGQRFMVVYGCLVRAWLHLNREDVDAARADLDEAWDIAERGPMRLYMADIHLYRARLFFREKPYPWKSPQDDLAAAEKLIHECEYHRRDEELADAKKAILGQ